VTGKSEQPKACSKCGEPLPDESNFCSNCGARTRALSNGLLKAYLTEWQLCQNNLKRHNDWAWQVGAIFIALSLGAIWATSQIEKVAENKIVVLILAFFSVSTIILGE